MARKSTPSRKSGKKTASRSRRTAKARPARGKGRKSQKGSKKRGWKRRLFAATGMLCLAIAALLGFYTYLASQIDLRDLRKMPERTHVLDFRGQHLGNLHGENRIFIPLNNVPQHFIDALLVREDGRFYQHNGLDYLGIGRATLRNIKDWNFSQGASTITMQLARNRYGMRSKTLHRKLIEAMLSRRIENIYSKDQILEAYINLVYFGSGAYGLEQASRNYFEKPASQLTLAESAMLVGLIRSPSRFSPFRNFDGAHDEMRTVLNRMVITNHLGEAERDDALNETILLRPPERRVLEDSWALDMVRGELEILLDDNAIREGGLTIHTSLDADLQKAAENALESHLTSIEKENGYPHADKAAFERELALWNATLNKVGPEEAGAMPVPGYIQGAVVVMENMTGGIRAVVGGRELRHSRFNRALYAKRQVGSTFKPFIYAAAFSNGLNPDGNLNDNPLSPGEITGAPNHWSPRNSDGTYQGNRPAWWGLVRSRNTMTVRAGQIAGMNNVRQLISDLALDPAPPPNPAIYLGSFSASPKDLTGSYLVFTNDGNRLRPYIINEIRDRHGRLLFKSGAMRVPILTPPLAHHTSRILERSLGPEGTGASAARLGIDFPAAGKTGTTDNFRDAWFVGYTSSLTTGVWVGFDRPQRTTWSGYGSRLALPVWAEVMLSGKESGYVYNPLP